MFTLTTGERTKMLQICTGLGGAGVCVQTASRWDGHNHASRWMLCWGSVEAMIGPPSPPPIQGAPTRRASATLSPSACRDGSDAQIPLDN